MKPLPDTLATLSSGMLFGLGLAWATMIRPESVIDFLNFRNLGLLLVLGAAVGINLLVYQLAPRLKSCALLGGEFQQRPFSLNPQTIVGGLIFGLGWGLCGVCPGPALAGIGSGDSKLLIALAGIFAGALLHGLWQQGQSRK